MARDGRALSESLLVETLRLSMLSKSDCGSRAVHWGERCGSRGCSIGCLTGLAIDRAAPAPSAAAQHPLHSQIGLLCVAARSVGLAQRTQHLIGSARGDGERVGVGGVEG